MIQVSIHAVDRYIERVAAVSREEARAALSSRVVEQAAEFGAHYVRLGTGQRIVIEAGIVVTVLPAAHYRRQVKRYGLGRYGKGETSSRYHQGE